MKKTILASLGGTLVALLAIEIIFRFTGFALNAPTRKSNEIRPEDAKAVRILALGESTTADYFADGVDQSWPRQLEAKLKALGYKVRVYNEAEVGTTSPFILSRLSRHLETYRPQIVISMMGINDIRGFEFHPDSNVGRMELWINDIRVIKLGSWLWNAFKARFLFNHFNLDETDVDYPPFYKALEMAKSQPVTEVEKFIRQDIKDDKKLGLLMRGLGLNLVGGNGQDYKLMQWASQYFHRAFDLYPDNQFITFDELGIVATLKHTERCRGLLEELQKLGPNVPDSLIARTDFCLYQEPSFRKSDIFGGHGIVFSTQHDEDPTVSNYRYLANELKRNHIALIAMQYPTLPLAALKGYFRDDKGQMLNPEVTFISNEESFKSALKKHPYGELFTDRFRGSWGHATTLGHSMIADAVASEVINIIEAKKTPQN